MFAVDGNLTIIHISCVFRKMFCMISWWFCIRVQCVNPSRGGRGKRYSNSGTVSISYHILAHFFNVCYELMIFIFLLLFLNFVCLFNCFTVALS